MSDEYSVGRGKPPRHTQFRPGQSGNPGGRPRGIRSFKADLDEELQQQVSLAGSSSDERITKQRLIVQKLVEMASAGDARATNTIILLCCRHEESGAPEDGTMSAGDAEIVKTVKKHT